eukprot:COSAG01_NODE_796_length_13536_cov_5.683635_1_plen_48_part_10
MGESMDVAGDEAHPERGIHVLLGDEGLPQQMINNHVLPRKRQDVWLDI